MWGKVIKTAREKLRMTKTALGKEIGVTMDAANGVLYKGDSQIVSKHTRKVYGETPKVIIKIEEIKDRYHGIF